MERKLVLGVDCGNSKTQYVLADTEGNVINHIRAGTASHENFADGYAGMKRELDLQIGRLIKDEGLEAGQIDFAVFGMAGIDREIQHRNCCDAISDLGFKRFLACNDAYLGIKAGSRYEYGICSINGAGTSCAAIDPHGRRIQIGGLGTTFGDDAGALHMGEMVIRRSYEQHFRCGESTKMSEMLFESLGISDSRMLVDAVCEKVFTTGELKIDEFSKFIFAAAAKGDVVARKLLRDTGNNTAQAVLGAMKHLDFTDAEGIDIILAGACYVKAESPEMFNGFKEKIDEIMDPRISYIILSAPPVAGAVSWAIEELAGGIEPGLKNLVCENLKLLDERMIFTCSGSC